jgi:hypothetical protein
VQKTIDLTRSHNVDAVSQQQRSFVGLPSQRTVEPAPSTTGGDGGQEKRWGFKLPSLRGAPALGLPRDKSAREERALERQRVDELAAIEAAQEAFFQTPAGRARLSYKRGHRLFQYELEINELQPLVIPGLSGTPSRETTDPVDVLNSVTVEGWKLVTGKFLYSDIRNGAVGCYLFKRSQKRRLAMNNPWQI